MSNDQETAQFDFSKISPARPEDLTPGMFLGKEKNYRLEKFLGAGGMGHAWLAVELEDGVELRKVVCKILPALVQREKEEMEKILKTFHLVQPLNHSNICPIYSLRSDPVYGYFFVIGYADGGSLWDWLQEQPDYANGLPVSQVVEVLRPIAQALDYAHEMGIMHRDVKPQNILFVTRKGRKIPWLIDFGISAQIHSTTTQTLGDSGSSGTPAYMAPEQCQSRLQDGRTDQYALGVLAYQLLSGRLPFEADNLMALMNRIVYDPVPSLTNVSAQANAAVQRAMAKDRKDRFESCVEFIDVLAGEKSFKPSLWNAVRPIVKALKKYQWPLIVCIFALLVVWFSLFNPSVKHPESIPEPSGTPGPNVAETVDEADFEMDGSTLTKYTGHAENLVIPAVIKGQKVTKIGIKAFKECSTLKTLTIPEGVTEIMYGAFQSNPLLTTVILPDSVEKIGEAFAYCRDFKQWIISPSNPHFKSDGITLLTKDGKILVACPAATGEYRIPEGVTEIGDCAFCGCSSLTSVVIPEGVTKIEAYAFKDCSSLTSVVIPEGVTKIEAYAFEDCSSLTSVVIPEGVTKIGWYAFSGCPNLTIHVPAGSAAEKYAKENNIPFEVKRQGNSDQEPQETEQPHPDPVEPVSKLTPTSRNSFKWAGTKIKKFIGKETEVVIPEGVTVIGDRAFDGCSSLTSVVIPNSVKEIGQDAFAGCTSLKEWSISSTHPYFKRDGVGLLTKDGKTLVACPGAAMEYRIPEGVTVIGDGAFEDCSSLTSVVIPEGVTWIRDVAFYGCSSLMSVVIPDSVKEIGDGAFGGCTSLKEWSISSRHPCFKTDGIALLTKDGKTLVTCPGAAKKYRIPEGVTEIGEHAFLGCSSLTSVVIPEGVTEIGGGAFLGCSSLTSVVIPEGVTEIGPEVFNGCLKLRIQGPAGSKIEEYAKKYGIPFITK